MYDVASGRSLRGLSFCFSPIHYREFLWGEIWEGCFDSFVFLLLCIIVGFLCALAPG